ncbi:hypothetical protein ACFQ9Q_11795 [Streptomyces virginiae]|uniref:hypothetical protein n=1 Tax=Streptomyces virginiae TaxID=1961 RepID=UPI003654A6A7
MSQQQAEWPDTAPEGEGAEPVLVAGPGADLHYHFPIHVVLAGDIAEETRRDIAAEIWDALHDALA